MDKEKKLRVETDAKVKQSKALRSTLEKEWSKLKKKVAYAERRVAKAMKPAIKIQTALDKERQLKAEALAKVADQAEIIDTMNKEVKVLEQKLTALDKFRADKKGQVKALDQTRDKKKKEQAEDVLVAEKQIVAQARSGEAVSKPGAAYVGAESKGMMQARASRAGRTSVSASKADIHYQRGVQEWDDGDIDGAIKEFKKAVRLDHEMAGALYNIGVAYWRRGDNDRAADYVYKAGLCYLRNGNRKQAVRMVVFLITIDPSSRLIKKLRTAISK